LGTTNYLYDGANTVEELNAADTVLARYAQGAGIDEPLAASRSTTEFYNADGLGSITSLGTSAGALSDSFVYDTFGNLGSLTGSFAQSFRYTSREWDSEAGLYYYRARYYDPQVGRFLSEDPIGFRAGINMFEYVHNNPTNSIDPSGKQAQKSPFCDRDGTCSIHLTCLPTHGTEFTHCDVTTRNGHL